MNYGRLAAIAIWTVVLLISYTAFIPATRLLPSHSESIEQERLIDAIVLVAMGVMAEDSMIDFSISSIRKVGNWRGEIYVLTDRKSCFSKSAIDFDLHLIEMEPLDTIMKIKALKPKLMTYLPQAVKGALYLDVDIIVTRDLQSFITDLKDTVTHSIAVREENEIALMKKLHESRGGIGNMPWNHSTSFLSFDYGAFLDAKGHYVGFCSGCEKWHTGVVWLQRQSEETRNRGNEAGQYNTDQESMDEAERIGACPRSLILPAKHLLFAKDYIGMALTAGQTFLHLTAAGRIESQDYLYREIVVPRLRNSLRPMLDPGIIKIKKQC